MKKIIVTLCSMALSLAGTFGINQLTSNDKAIIESIKQQINIEQDAETVEKTDSADKANIETKDKVEDKASKKKEATPQTKKAETKDKDTTKVEKNTTANKDKKKDKKQSTVKTTTTPSNNSGSVQGYAEEVLRLVNIERSKAGLSALTTNSTLRAAADKRAQETKVSFSHTRPNGSKFSTVLQEYGISYRTAGENIAYGQRSPEEVVKGWMNSPGHRANILNANFSKIGIGVYQSGGVLYWTQLFTN